MSNEEKKLKLIIGDDGVFREYNDEFDITIHCESQEEQDRVLKQLKEVFDGIPKTEEQSSGDDNI